MSPVIANEGKIISVCLIINQTFLWFFYPGHESTCCDIPTISSWCSTRKLFAFSSDRVGVPLPYPLPKFSDPCSPAASTTETLTYGLNQWTGPWPIISPTSAQVPVLGLAYTTNKPDRTTHGCFRGVPTLTTIQVPGETFPFGQRQHSEWQTLVFFLRQ